MRPWLKKHPRMRASELRAYGTGATGRVGAYLRDAPVAEEAPENARLGAAHTEPQRSQRKSGQDNRITGRARPSDVAKAMADKPAEPLDFWFRNSLGIWVFRLAAVAQGAKSAHSPLAGLSPANCPLPTDLIALAYFVRVDYHICVQGGSGGTLVDDALHNRRGRSLSDSGGWGINWQ